MTDAFDRHPPCALEAEVAVLGALFVDRGAMLTVLPLLREADFYREAHRRIFRAAVALHEVGTPIDPVAVANELQRTGEFEATGGYGYMSSLLDAVPSAANVAYHAGIVRDKAQLRRIIDGAASVIRSAYDEGDLATVGIQVAALTAQAGGSVTGGFRLVKESLWPAFERIEEMQEKGGQTGVPTGFSRLDRMLSGLQDGDLIVVAARPSAGKTAWVLNALTHAAGASIPAALVSLEMSAAQLTIRQIASMARIDMQKLRRGHLSPEEHQRMAAAAGRLNNMPLWLDDHPVSRVGELRAKLTRLVRQEGVRVAAIDYLQLMEGSGEENRRLEIEGVTRGLKLLAKDLNVPLLLLSQLSRAPEGRTNHRPMLSDLRESGSIEQDADVVLFLYREEMYIQDSDSAKKQAKAQQSRADTEGKTELIVAKQRNGPTGTIPLYFHKAYTRFDSVDEHPSDGGTA